MSRTKHHKGQHNRHWGKDFCARHNVDKNHGGGTGPYTKNKADRKTLDEHSIRLTVPEQKALKRALSRSVKIIA